MKSSKLEQQAIITSEYVEIIENMTQSFWGLSLIKVALFSYIIRKRKFYRSPIHDGKTKKDLVTKVISELSGNLNDFLLNLKYVLLAVDILVASNRLLYVQGNLTFNGSRQSTIDIDGFIANAIEESRKYSDRQIMKEILQNV